jgi:microcompartment protein CcmL/EutN
MADEFGPALGFVETRGLVGAIEAADTMVKTARVQILGIEKTVPALMSVRIRGDVASVQAAIEAGAAAANRIGQLVSSLVISNPAAGLESIFSSKGRASDSTTIRRSSADGGTPGSETRLEEMTVIELRALARTIADFPLQGRAVASANKRQLLDAFAAHQGT